MAEEYIVTQDGYDKLVAEYDELVAVRRKEVSERLKEAISYGDLSENAEYDAAKNEQAELEERIFELENLMKSAKVVSDDETNKDFVGVGTRVTVKNLDTKETQEYFIVGATESDPFAEPVPKISNESAIGQALLGKKKKDKVEIVVPDGIINMQVVDITR